jgi:ABC-2 type transport system ATP-binding protein
LALIPDPRVVFLDELTTGLDPRARREVWRILSGLKENGLAVVCIGVSLKFFKWE